MSTDREREIQSASLAHLADERGRAMWLMGREHGIETKIDLLIAEGHRMLPPGRPFEIRITRGQRTEGEHNHAVSWFSSHEMAINPQEFAPIERTPAAASPAHPVVADVYVVGRFVAGQ